MCCCKAVTLVEHCTSVFPPLGRLRWLLALNFKKRWAKKNTLRRTWWDQPLFVVLIRTCAKLQDVLIYTQEASLESQGNSLKKISKWNFLSNLFCYNCFCRWMDIANSCYSQIFFSLNQPVTISFHVHFFNPTLY